MTSNNCVLLLYISVIYYILFCNCVFARPRVFKEGDIRLIGGREDHKGTVLIYHDEKWGAICDHRWDIRDAIVACYQLGYSGAERAALRSEFGRGRRRMWLSHVSCRGYEERIDQCQSPGYGANNCRGSFHSAGVECTISPTTPTPTTTSTTQKTTTTTVQTTTRSTTQKPTTQPTTTTTTTTLPPITRAPTTTTPAVTPSPWVWDDETNTWLWKPHNEPTIVTFQARNEDDEPKDIFEEILNDEAAIPQEDINYAEYSAPETLVYNIPNEIETESTELESRSLDDSSLSESSEPIHIELIPAQESNEPVHVELVPALTSPRPTTQTPWMWDDTLAQYILRPQNGRRTESPWIWDHENEQYVLRSEYERQHAANQPPQESLNVEIAPLVDDRQHDSAHVRDPLEMLTYDANVQNDPESVPQPAVVATESEGVYEVPFIPEVADPDEYLHAEPMVEETNFEHQQNSEHHVHSHDQSLEQEQESLAIPLQPVEQNTHSDGYQTENSQEHNQVRSDNVIPTENVYRESPLIPTHNSPYAATEQFYNHQLPVHNDPYKEMAFRVEGGRRRQEGRIEVRPPYQSRWGVICGDMWTIKEAIVACREFGLGYAQSASKTAYYGGTDKDKLFWRVKCVGNERKLEDCAWEDHNGAVKCSRRDSIAGIVCTNELPDLIPNVTALETSSFLQDRHLYYLQCSMEENCLSSSAYEVMKTPNWMTTTRRLLRFSSIVHNRGTADFVPFVPRHLWEWHACHMHYHSMEVFARYDVVDDHGNRVAEGLKASFCLEDSACDYGVHPKYNCDGYGHQGIAVGCSDNYLADIDCQWIDMTDVKPGTYTFKLEVNPELRVAEMNFENNVVTCTLWYGGYRAQLQGCRLGSLL